MGELVPLLNGNASMLVERQRMSGAAAQKNLGVSGRIGENPLSGFGNSAR